MGGGWWVYLPLSSLQAGLVQSLAVHTNYLLSELVREHLRDLILAYFDGMLWLMLGIKAHVINWILISLAIVKGHQVHHKVGRDQR